MEEIKTGVCRYCGQANLGLDYDGCQSQHERDTRATKECDCPAAKREREKAKQKLNACERMQSLFGPNAEEEYGLKPVDDHAIDLLEGIISYISEGVILAASVQIDGECKAKISLTNKDKIKVERTNTCKYQLEE